MTQITIKTAISSDDIKTTEKLAREIWTQHYHPIIGQAQVEYMLNKYQSYDSINQSINDGYIYYLAYYKEGPCGYSAIRKDNGVFLSKFYVRESHRGLGIGKTMMNTIIDYANENNLDRIWLTCNKFNSNALEIYKKLGFEIVDSIVTDIGNGFVMDDYVLVKGIYTS